MTKMAISLSLGSSRRDKKAEIELLGEKVIIERRGTDGDVARLMALFAELDGQVDAFGLGGMDLWVHMDAERRYPLHAGQKLVRHVRRTPVVDGNGLKNTLERRVLEVLVARLGPDYRTGRALLTVAVDRYGMTQAFFHSDYDVVCGDLMFALGLGLPVRSERQLRLLARLLVPVASRLPISMLYPTGEKQEQIVPRFGRWYGWATVIAGDCHYIKRHMPPDLGGKVIVTNTTTEADMEAFRQRGVAHVMTTTPVIEGRSFGTNMLEAALTAVAGRGRPLTVPELESMLVDIGLQPSLRALNSA